MGQSGVEKRGKSVQKAIQPAPTGHFSQIQSKFSVVGQRENASFFPSKEAREKPTQNKKEGTFAILS